MAFKIDMGAEVKDHVTEFKGVITARTEFISGCIQYIVQPKCGKDGKKPEGQWFDEDRLIVTKKAKKIKTRPTGGPQYIPSVNH